MTRDWTKLLRQYTEHAREVMEEQGEVRPLFILYAEGKLIVFPAAFRNEAEKRHVLSVVRMLAVVHDAEEAGFMTEAWVASAKVGPGEDAEAAMDRLGPPSQSPARKEVVMISACFREQGAVVNRGAMLPIMRDDAGNPSLGEPQTSADPGSFTGRFADLILPMTAPDRLRRDLRTMLEAMGVSYDVRTVFPEARA